MKSDLPTLAFQFWGLVGAEVAPSPTGNKENYFANIAMGYYAVYLVVPLKIISNSDRLVNAFEQNSYAFCVQYNM